ncbi:acetyl-CoA carboxylase biotin carboxylase subunit [Microbacterium sp. ZW T5_45]
MFHTVLIANRGEIACRIIRTLRALGIRSVAVYSDADADARHVRLADVAVRLGPAPAASSYLDADAVLDAARRTGAQAIHPGYGFLSENASFARACAEAGIVFIGPTAEAISIMGDKITAKTAVGARGVPTVPGVAHAGMTDDELVDAAASVGYPLLIKPSAGGGGKGMHVVEAADALPGALAAARREAAASFGDDTLFLERYVHNPRHIEVQVLADAHGAVIHLGERECSLQRRHQKVIEEAPSPLLDAETRERIGRAACETARSVDYRGAGTVEFIVSADRPDEFFFMEMNTRLQVEHPVTEEVTGIDLVEQQLRVAAGEPLALTQDDIVLRGHAIEARVYAEDPAAGFLPTGGHVDRVHHPAGAGVRVDTALEDGLDVSVDYDPMLAKVIAWGADRDEARRRLISALGDTAVFGFTTNVEFLRMLLEVPAVASGDLDTGLIARVLDSLEFVAADERTFVEAAVLIDAQPAALPRANGAGGATASAFGSGVSGRGGPRADGPWARRDGWRLGAPADRRYRLRYGDSMREVRLVGASVRTDDGLVPVRMTDVGDGRVTVDVGGEVRTLLAHVDEAGVALVRQGAVIRVDVDVVSYAADAAGVADPEIVSPMPGTVVVTYVSDGDRVAVGDPVIAVEAMKMEHAVTASVAGVVTMRAARGDVVARGQVLATIVADPGEGDE